MLDNSRACRLPMQTVNGDVTHVTCVSGHNNGITDKYEFYRSTKNDVIGKLGWK